MVTALPFHTRDTPPAIAIGTTASPPVAITRPPAVAAGSSALCVVFRRLSLATPSSIEMLPRHSSVSSTAETGSITPERRRTESVWSASLPPSPKKPPPRLSTSRAYTGRNGDSITQLSRFSEAMLCSITRDPAASRPLTIP